MYHLDNRHAHPSQFMSVDYGTIHQVPELAEVSSGIHKEHSSHLDQFRNNTMVRESAELCRISIQVKCYCQYKHISADLVNSSGHRTEVC